MCSVHGYVSVTFRMQMLRAAQVLVEHNTKFPVSLSEWEVEGRRGESARESDHTGTWASDQGERYAHTDQEGTEVKYPLLRACSSSAA